MLEGFPLPDAQPLSSFAPSNVNGLVRCPLQVGFSRDSELKGWRRPSMQTALGRAAHAVTEFAFSPRSWPDEPFDVRSVLEDIWDQSVEAEMVTLTEAWSPADPPAPRHWPHYQVTRIRTLRRSEREISGFLERQRDREPRADQGEERPFVVPEARLSDPVSGLYGWADRIQRTRNGFRIIDLKTGVNQGAASEDQERQLLLYGVLCHRTFGEWPTEIVVENASGDAFPHPLEPEKAESALADATVLVGEFNASVVDPSTLVASAAPTPDVCRWCDFKVACRRYAEEAQAAWGHRVLGGRVQSSIEAPNGFSVTVEPRIPKDLPGPVTISQIATPIPAMANWIIVDGLQGQLEAGDAVATWSSRVRVW